MPNSTRRALVLLVATFAMTLLSQGCAKTTVQKDASRPADQVAARHILVMHQGSERAPGEITRTKDEAKALIDEVLGKLKSGAKFEELAVQYSDCPSAAKGGDLGSFGRNQMTPAFEEAAFACPVGQATDVVETPFGYHIIYRYE
ncbi:MAG: peptidylprolyl isomerase [Thermoguttaceae bacterium]